MDTLNDKENGVYQLISKLCYTAFVSNSSFQGKQIDKAVMKKMKSHCYELILKNSHNCIGDSKNEPIGDLLSICFVLHKNAKNVAEYKRAVDLKKAVSQLRHTDFGEYKETMLIVIQFLVKLADSIQFSSFETYKKPFSFGLLTEMLPRPTKESFGSPEPYAYYPSHIFELPFALREQSVILDKAKSYQETEYTVETFDSRTCLNKQSLSNVKAGEIITFLSPMSLASMTSTNMSPYSQSTIFDCPRLTGPRDLFVPSLTEFEGCKVSMPSTNNTSKLELDLKDVYLPRPDQREMDIWELASQVDKDIPNDIWDVVSKLPIVEERRILASLPREMALWRRKYEDRTDLFVVPEKVFIRQIMYLIIGIETKVFQFDTDTNSFHMKDNVILEGMSQELLKGHIKDLLLIGTYYKRLYLFAFNQSLEDYMHKKGLIYEAAREVVRNYLLEFRLKAVTIFEECCDRRTEDVNCMPTLLQISLHMEALKYEIETIASIYNMTGQGSKRCLPLGAELMSYLFDRISLVTHPTASLVNYNFLYSICKVYFKFIEIFVFQGELDDRYDEFFIKKDSQYANSQTKRYWDKGFHMVQSVAVPDFLRSLAKYILLCGKSLRLLKLCNPNDPLIVLMSSDHPTVKACYSFEQLERQQRILDVYRTRCLFVSGEPVTFAQIMLKREAERKAFSELATLKQAETMEKIVAERKRLAQLILAEKQHSFKVLEAAMAEAKAARGSGRHQEKHKSYQENISDEVDAKLKDKERNKIMEYYSKLNMEVEKSKIHTEWKIKRLQLDQIRMQLLSTEETMLKREKLELEHKKSEDIMAMSIQSVDSLSDNKNDNFEVVDDPNNISEDTNYMSTAKEISTETEFENNKIRSNSSKNVFSAICNAAKNIFRVSRHDDCRENSVDKELDSQGNVIETQMFPITSNAYNETHNRGDAAKSNYQLILRNQEAMYNKQKMLSHDFGSTDEENNLIQNTTLTNITKVDAENNVEEFYSQRREAIRNKLKVLGDEFGIIDTKVNQSFKQPATDAQKEAFVNKQKVLGVEYNLPFVNVSVREPANQAQKEALEIRKRMTSGFDCDDKEEMIFKARVPQNIAQEEAIDAKNKILGTSYNMYPIPVERIAEEKSNNVKLFSIKPELKETELESVEMSNKIQNQASSLNDIDTRCNKKRSVLLLNLKSPNEVTTNSNTGPTPDTEFFTPAGFFTRLDLETPTTAEIPLGAPDYGNFTPHSDESVNPKSEKSKHVSLSEGFDFSLIDDEVAESVENENLEFDTTTKHKSNEDATVSKNFSIFDMLDGSPKISEIDPFGVKQFKSDSRSHLSSRMDLAVDSVYTHPSIIMQRIETKPDLSMFWNSYEDRVTDDSIATLTACLQKSITLPLTYQLELVNNATLTHFLVNLDLYEHLSCLKDYFFLMDGEFSKSICENLFAKLEKTTNPQQLLNFATLHSMLDKALGSSVSHPHKFTEHLSFLISECPLSFQHSSPDVLQCLSLTYTVTWPLNIILSHEALLRYSKVFQFLIKMRRIFWVLGEAFQHLKLAVKLCDGNPRKLLSSPQYVTLQLYRHIMASLIRALDNYIVTTCISTSWREFESDLKKARTLDDLYDCHVVYVKKVMFRCLLNNRSTPVMKLLNDIFTVMLKYCRALKAGEWLEDANGQYYTHTNYIQLVEIYHLHEKLVKYLHRVINKLMDCGYQRHLAELLTMVNLNGYYDPDKSKEESILA